MQTPGLMSLVFGLLILALIFSSLERLWPSIRGQGLFRKGFRLDLCYWFFTPLVTRVITRVALMIPVIILAVVAGAPWEEFKNRTYKGFGPVSLQPLWVQALELLIMADLIGYWMHRLFHTGRWWPFHAVHHSSTELDWLSSVRLHPVNDVVTRLAQVIPPLCLGFNPFALAFCVPLLSLHAILTHANVNWTFGPLQPLLASPVFHRWHHSKRQGARDKNFAGLFPVWDILFGTYYMPPGRRPDDFGIHEPMTEKLWDQLTAPFRRR
ncbi:sterol desaturase family protein [Oscillatoria laete-virens NRMC-F 0139]|nr:sterol desaturase family protein [Oscillatoria laete-virens]MDL5052321.1 sterol desaturase family protein [Oscillatoria laete-virens NRMC-F 0139]